MVRVLGSRCGVIKSRGAVSDYGCDYDCNNDEPHKQIRRLNIIRLF